MNLRDAIAGRRSVRRFRPDPVPEEVVMRVLDLAVMAPSASNKQPWRFLVVRDRATIDRMAEAVREQRARIVRAVEEPGRAAIEAYGTYFTRFSDAPLVIVPIHRSLTILSTLVGDRLDEGSRDAVVRMERESGLIGTSLAMQNLLLAAHAEGLGASGMTGPLIARARLREILEVPASWDIVALVPLGWPAEAPEAPDRKAAARVTRWIG
jgi:nitroreductase